MLDYDPCNIVCSSHRICFVRFVHRVASRYNSSSHGCPVCVGLIRAKVQMEINRGIVIGKHGKRIRTSTKRKVYAPRVRPSVKKKVGLPERIAATGVEVART